MIREATYRWEVHQQQVKLIRQQESDDHHSQSLGQAEQPAEQRNEIRFHEALCMEYHVSTSIYSD